MWGVPQRVSEEGVALSKRWERLFIPFVTGVCFWSLIEIPLELGVSIDSRRLLVVAASKVMMICVGVAAIVNLRFARQVFAFICAASVLAIAPALPIEYGQCVSIALFSTVECIGKCSCVAVAAIASLCKRSSY